MIMGNLDKQPFIVMCIDGPCSHYDYSKEVRLRQHAVLCDSCYRWQHKTCNTETSGGTCISHFQIKKMASYKAGVPDKEYIHSLLEKYIECAEFLIGKCRALHHIKGAEKLERKCVAELRFLKSLSRKRSGFDESHLRSSNLSHYLGVIHAAENLPHVTQILQAFRCPGRTENLHVDVVGEHGRLWVKVIARKGQALHLIWAGQGQYGDRDIFLQAKDYVTCATVHPVNFMTPKMVFAFYNGVTSQMGEELRQYKVIVLGEIVSIALDVEQKLASLNVVEDSDDSETDSHCALNDEIIKYQTVQVIVKEHSMTANKALSDKTCCSTQSRDERDSLSDSEFACLLELNRKSSGRASNSVALRGTQVDIDRSNALGYNYNVISEETNTSTQQVASNQKICGINQEYDSEIASQTSHIVADRLCTQNSCIDSVMLSDSGHSNPGKLGSFNLGDCIKTNKCQGLRCQQNQFRQDSQSGFGNEFGDKPHSEFSISNWTSLALTEFIARELLTSNTVDYSQLDGILTENSMHSIDSIGKINLDVTSLITLVSAVAHGKCYFRFKEPILTEQAAEERRDPVMPKLQKFIAGKALYACQTAVDSFQTILDTLGGYSECARAKELMQKVTVVPDNPSFRTECLPNTGKIKKRSKIIFGTGDSLQAVTLTANSGYVRAAQHQGVLFAVYIHASRALTEQKEETAERIDP